MPGTSRIRQRVAPIVLSVLAAAAVACTEQNGPTAAQLGLDGADRAGHDSGQQADSTYSIHGRVLRFSGEGGDSLPNDTLGAALPVPGALVEAYFLAHVDPDTGDTLVPPDTVFPPDTGDTIRPPVDSSRIDSLMLASAGQRILGSWVDTSSGGGGGGGKPARAAAWDRTDGQGYYELRDVPRGIYRVEVTPPGSQSPAAWSIVVVSATDVWMHPFLLPPKR